MAFAPPITATATKANSAAASTTAAPAAPVRRLGRYELRRLLGKSGGSMTWLALDPSLGAEVMLTLPRLQPPDAEALAHWTRDVQQAARLDHPQLARVAEVGVHERWPYVVVERSVGRTLGERLAEGSPPTPAEAAAWIADATLGLAFAHEANCSHGDLQLHTLLIDDQGAARVMALAVASPQVVSAPAKTAGPASAADGDPYRGLRSHRAAVERDMLACTLLLHTLLAGRPPLDQADTALVIEQLPPSGRAAVRLPWATAHPLPEALRAIANRGTSAHARERYLSARTLWQALNGWLEGDRQGQGGPLALLLDRLHTVGHLPAEPGAAARLAKLATLDAKRTDEIADHVLGDLALSFELLRQVNSAQVQTTQAAGGPAVLTVRRSVALLGLNGVRRAANALRSWPGPLNEAGAEAMRRVLDRSLLAARIAQSLRPVGYDPEVMRLIAALQNLGRLLVHYHFQDEAAQITQLAAAYRDHAADPAQQAATAADRPISGAPPAVGEEAAAYAVMGVNLEGIGLAVVRVWGFGDDVLHMMRRLPLQEPVRVPHTENDMLRVIASLANELADTAAVAQGPQLATALVALARRYGTAVGCTVQDLQDALAAEPAAGESAASISSDAVARSGADATKIAHVSLQNEATKR